jgi:hypothetical protein
LRAYFHQVMGLGTGFARVSVAGQSVSIGYL